MKAPDKSQKYETEEFVNELFFIDSPEELINDLVELYMMITHLALKFDNLGDIGISAKYLGEKLYNIPAIIDALRLVKRKEAE